MQELLVKQIAQMMQEEKDKATILTCREASVIMRIDYRTLLNKIHQGLYEFKSNGYRHTISMYQIKKYL